MFRASLCPSSGEQKCALPHMVFCTGCDDSGCVELGRKLCAPCTFTVWSCDASCVHCAPSQCTQLASQLHTTTVIITSAEHHMRQCTLVLLMMGIMMPETCWDKSLIISIRLVPSCWFFSLFTLLVSFFSYLSNLLHTWLSHSLPCNHPSLCYPTDFYIPYRMLLTSLIRKHAYSDI